MEKIYLIKIKLPLTILDRDSRKHCLHTFMHFTRKSLEQQTFSQFTCLVEYPLEIEKPLLFELTQYPELPTNIIFTSSSSLSLRDKILPIDLSSYDYLYFINAAYNTLFQPTFLEILSAFTPPEESKVLRFSNHSSYNLTTNTLSTVPDESITDFVYACTRSDYERLFKVYDFYHPEILTQNFKIFPNDLSFSNQTLSLIIDPLSPPFPFTASLPSPFSSIK